MNARTRLATLLFAPALLFACGGGESGGSSGSSAGTTKAPPPSVKVEAPAAGAAGEPAPEGAPASVSGVVRFEGAAPERKQLSISTEGCCLDGPPRYSEALIVNDGRLQNVIVSISKGLTGYEAPPPPTEPHYLHQKCCIYTPHVSAVQVGQKLLVTNDDEVTHNVHTFPKRATAKNVTQGAGAQPLELVFEREEPPVRVGCDIHPWMSAYVGLFEHPFFAVTGEDGAFSIEGLPPGKYTLAFWHETLGKKSVELELGPGAAGTVELAYAAK